MPAGSRHLQPSHRPGRRSKFICLEAEAMKHGDEEIGQGLIMVLIERQMLAMLETTPGENSRQVRRDVGVGVAEIGAVNDHGAIQERVIAFADGFKLSK